METSEGERSLAGPSIDTDNPDWEYTPLRLPPGISRKTAATQLAVQAEFAGWELSRVRLYSDGTRQVMLRRKRRRTPVAPPGLSV